MKRWYVEVKKTPCSYRLTLPLEHTFFFSVRELITIYNWCASNLEELEREAQREEQREADIIFGKKKKRMTWHFNTPTTQ